MEFEGVGVMKAYAYLGYWRMLLPYKWSLYGHLHLDFLCSSFRSFSCVVRHCYYVGVVQLSSAYYLFFFFRSFTCIFFSVGDDGMEPSYSTYFLKTLQLVKCQEISDDGLQLVAQFLQLSILRLSKCLGVTDDGFKPLVGSDKLDVLVVEDCPQLSERGVQRAAKTVI